MTLSFYLSWCLQSVVSFYWNLEARLERQFARWCPFHAPTGGSGSLWEPSVSRPGTPLTTARLPILPTSAKKTCFVTFCWGEGVLAFLLFTLFLLSCNDIYIYIFFFSLCNLHTGKVHKHKRMSYDSNWLGPTTILDGNVTSSIHKKIPHVNHMYHSQRKSYHINSLRVFLVVKSPGPLLFRKLPLNSP